MRDLQRLPVLKLDDQHVQHIEDEVVVEEPLEVRVNGESVSVTMRTPGNDFDLAIGLLWTEGIIRSRGEIGTIAYCPDEDQPELKNVVNVGLVDANRKLQSSRRLWSNSSCGLCGKATLDAHVLLSVHRFFFPGSIGLNDGFIRIGQKREVQIEFVFELFM